jgi:hypothetical protein
MSSSLPKQIESWLAPLEAIRSFPTQREVEHCETRIVTSPFDFYAECARCGTRIKVRSFSATGEIEDVFDAIFEWRDQPAARDAARRRQADLEEDDPVDE